MGNTFVDGQEKIVERDFVTVRTSGGRLVFMGERKNIKCFDRLKKVSERAFETLAGQTYRFLDKMPEPAAKIEITQAAIVITDEMQKRAEESWLAHCMERQATPVQTVKPEPKLMTFEEQLAHDWRFNPGIRKEFISFGSYQAFMRAEKAGRTKVYGRGQGTSTR